MRKVDTSPPDSEIVARGESTLLVKIAGRTVQPFVVYDLGYRNGVYHQVKKIAKICLRNNKRCASCEITIEDCRNKEINRGAVYAI